MFIHSSDSGYSVCGNSLAEMPFMSNLDFPHLISVILLSSFKLKLTASLGNFEIISKKVVIKSESR